MSGFETVQRARKMLGLGETATFEEIKDAYRELAKQYHPDTCKSGNSRECVEKMKEINKAKEIILDYCARYRFSFREDDFKMVNSAEQFAEDYLKRFYHDWF